MSNPKCLNFADYNKYSSESNPTTNAEMQDYMGNQNELMKVLSGFVWQPETALKSGQIVLSRLDAGNVAVVTTAGTTGATEPTWAGSGTDVTDGTVTYKMCNLPTRIVSTGTGNAFTGAALVGGVLTLTKGITFSTTDTKNTSGATNTTNKLYLTGATEQSANPQTYSNINCYAQGGYLYSGGAKVLTSVGTVIAAKGNATQPVYISAANTATACTMAASNVLGLLKSIGQNLNTNGYVQLNNGLTICWNYIAPGRGGNYLTWQYAKSFTTVFAVVCSRVKDDSSSSMDATVVRSFNTSSAIINTSGSAAGYCAIAIGIV